MKRSRLTFFSFIAVTFLVTTFAIYGIIGFQRDLRTLDNASREDIAWTAGQLEMELTRLITSLLLFQIEGSGVTPEDVNTRFDILWSRVAIFREGAVGRRLSEYDRDTASVDVLMAAIRAVDPLVVGLKAGDNETAREILSELNPFLPILNDLVREVTQGEEALNRSVRETMMVRTNRTLFVSLFATVFALLSLAIIYRQSLNFAKLAEVNHRLAQTAEKASATKSKFLSMMSHELRTPMNGVMGLLALAKQNSVSPSQKRLLDQAEVSAQSMLSLLSDIFDYSALQADDIQLDIKPFDPAALKSSLDSRFERFAKRAGIKMPITLADNLPTRVLGDFKRIRQSISHIAQYIAETAGTREACITLDHTGSSLQVRLGFTYSVSGGEWNTDLLMGDAQRDGDKIATAALGPMIARGLLEAMTGHVKLDIGADDQIVVLIEVPAPIVELKSTKLRIFAKSGALIAICKAALKGDDIQFLDDSSNEIADVVLIESGHDKEHQFLTQARNVAPGALFIALGTPIEPDNFDFSISLPMNFPELRRVIAGDGTSG